MSIKIRFVIHSIPNQSVALTRTIIIISYTTILTKLTAELNVERRASKVIFVSVEPSRVTLHSLALWNTTLYLFCVSRCRNPTFSYVDDTNIPYKRETHFIHFVCRVKSMIISVGVGERSVSSRCRIKYLIDTLYSGLL